MNGWDEAFLQGAIDQCVNDTSKLDDCPLLIPLNDGRCKIDNSYKRMAAVQREDCTGPMSQLCGNPVLRNAFSTAPESTGPLEASTEPFSAASATVVADIEAPQQTISTATNSNGPPFGVSTVVERVAVTEDVWRTVYEKRNRHLHHPRQS